MLNNKRTDEIEKASPKCSCNFFRWLWLETTSTNSSSWADTSALRTVSRMAPASLIEPVQLLVKDLVAVHTPLVCPQPCDNNSAWKPVCLQSWGYRAEVWGSFIVHSPNIYWKKEPLKQTSMVDPQFTVSGFLSSPPTSVTERISLPSFPSDLRADPRACCACQRPGPARGTPHLSQGAKRCAAATHACSQCCSLAFFFFLKNLRAFFSYLV